nr:hypothetical protein [Lachnospiraceae bacterium]
MKNKKVQAMLATAIVSAALAGGCGFNPAEEEMAEVYGPAPYEEEVIITEEEENKKEEQVSENDIKKEEEQPEEVFVPENETEVCVYGPAPTE